MVPQGKVWRVKAVDQPARPVEPPQATGLTAQSNRSDRLRLQQSRKPNWQCPFWFLAMEKHHWHSRYKVMRGLWIVRLHQERSNMELNEALVFGGQNIGGW